MPSRPTYVLNYSIVADSEDTAEDLHTVVNVIQENALRGGFHYLSPTQMMVKTRSYNDVTRNVAINTALWNEATVIMQQAA